MNIHDSSRMFRLNPNDYNKDDKDWSNIAWIRFNVSANPNKKL